MRQLPLNTFHYEAKADGRELYRIRGGGVTVGLTVFGDSVDVTSFDKDPNFDADKAERRVSCSSKPQAAVDTGPKCAACMAEKDGFQGRVKSFLRIVSRTAVDGKIPVQVHDHRVACCTGLDKDGRQVSEPCRYAKRSGGHWYCGACGCAQWWMAQLDGGMLWHPELECPAGHFSKVTTDGG